MSQLAELRKDKQSFSPFGSQLSRQATFVTDGAFPQFRSAVVGTPPMPLTAAADLGTCCLADLPLVGIAPIVFGPASQLSKVYPWYFFNWSTFMTIGFDIGPFLIL